ncbi:MAG: hypothetical protein B6244_04165 [Candidatus Cloacimonetes bacterium 4572_55]|nr:MAG: hypothetical protein B6244_04165 [Candidatus Cloacimonetes bacterium 4572_55]
MKKLHYLKINNFKVFGEEVTIDLDQPAVLIGPNNSGKTAIIQAITLWSLGLKTWFKHKGASKAKRHISTGINRLNIIQAPIPETRYFWKNAAIRQGNSPILMSIEIGLEFDGGINPCGLVFKYQSAEVIYCYPDETTRNTDGLIEYATKLNVELLYPMSGIETEEPLLQMGRINVLLGQGQTAHVLRNLCYIITENDTANQTKDWGKVTALMKKLFGIQLEKPTLYETRGSINLKYIPEHYRSRYPLDRLIRNICKHLLKFRKSASTALARIKN